MSYNWQPANTPQGRERLKELLDLGVKVPCRDVSSICSAEWRYLFPEIRSEHFRGSEPRVYYRFGFPYDVYEDSFVATNGIDWLTAIEFLDPEPQAQQPDENGLPTDDEIHFVAVYESHSDRHGWQSLNQKPAYVDGFEDGVKWMRNKREGGAK